MQSPDRQGEASEQRRFVYERQQIRTYCCPSEAPGKLALSHEIRKVAHVDKVGRFVEQ